MAAALRECCCCSVGHMGRQPESPIWADASAGLCGGEMGRTQRLLFSLLQMDARCDFAAKKGMDLKVGDAALPDSC